MRTGPFTRLSGRLVIAALIAAPLPLLSSAPALAGPAAPTQLSPDSTTVGGQPMLEWKRVKGAAEYDVEISTQDDFSTTVYEETTENTRATPTQALPSGDLYWRVRGITSTQVRGSWARASFSQDVVAGPLQLAPEDGADLQQPDDPPLLSWTPITGATSYSIEVDSDDQFVDATTYASKTNAYTIPDPGSQQTYYWHVRANLSGGITSDWSADWSFDVLALAAPVLTAPDDSATTQVQDVVLDWKPVPGAVKYELRVSTDDQFTNALTKTVVSTRYSPPTSYNNDQYWWQVRAIDVNNNKSPWTTSLNQFQRSWPNRPQLLYPADGASVSDHVFFQWDPVPLASSYQIDVAPDPSFSPTTYDSCDTLATTFTTGRLDATDCTPPVDGIYYWRVRALDGPAKNPEINGLFSEIHSFNFDAPVVTQLAPAYDPVNSPEVIPTVEVPELRWEEYPDTERYRVKVFKAGGTQATSATTYSTSWTPDGNTRLDPDDGPFRWTVEALGANGSVTPVLLQEVQWKFNVTASLTDDPEVPAQTPTSPTNAHSYRCPALSWEPYAAEDGYYMVWVAAVGSSAYTAMGGGTGKHYPYPAATDETKSCLVAGQYHWYANFYSPQGQLLSSGLTNQGVFTVDSLPVLTGARLSLTGLGLQNPSTTCQRSLSEVPSVCGNLQQTPIFAWDSVPGAGYYMLYVSKDRELTNLTGLDNTDTVSTSWIPTELLPESQAGTAYYWVVRPCKAKGVCEAEPTEATNAFDKRSNAVTGLTEMQHESDIPLAAMGPGGALDFPEFADEIVLSWDDYLETNQAGNASDVTGMASTVEAMSYEVEMGEDPNFPSTDTVESGRIDQTTYTPYLETLPEGPLYWRVRAIDGDGNPLPWSAARSAGGGSAAIEKRSPTTTLISPANGQMVSQTPALTWDPLAYAAQYTIQISRNGDTTFSTANRVLSSSTKQTSFVPTSTLDAAGSPYVWRVRRTDFNGRAGEWTAARIFSVAADAPTQVSPAPSVYVSASDALFTWMPSPGAATYRFERRALGSTSAQETKSTVGLSWAPLKILSDGRYEWRVSSYDAGNKLLASSLWSPFVVDATAPKVVRKSPTNVAQPTSTFKVDFSEKVSGVSSANFAIFLKGNPHKLPASVKVTNQKRSALLLPSGKLKVGKSYTIKLLKGIKDGAGHRMKPTNWTVEIRRG